MKNNRKRAQAFCHQFDWYANPVTLTYSQKKSFTTVPGAICSIISGILLSYYVILNVLVFFIGTNWIQSEQFKPVDHENPDEYTITYKNLSLGTKIASDDPSISSADMDTYVEGVYLQLTIPKVGDAQYEYIQAVPCLDLHKDDLPENIQKAIEGYMCPKVSEVKI